MDKKKLTVKEAAEFLNVKSSTVRQYIKTGKLKSEKIKKGLKYFYLIEYEVIKQFKESL